MENQTILILLMVSFICIEESYGNKALSEACASKETCGECIQTSGCQWCSAPIDETNVRCRHKSEFSGGTLEEWCPTPNDYVENPVMNVEVVQDDDFGEYKRRTVQIKPQEVHLKLRVDEPYELKFQYRRAKDYPVDLYYLMDLSGSMADDKENLAKLGNKLAETMRSITENFKIGFGSFVDKVEAPYVSTAPKKLAHPCADKDNCTAPYSFINQMPLDSDYKQFSIRVRSAEISGNLDSPEGGFDALMQAIVCSKEIGWRPEARHLLVFSTDASFHLAGDGKLAGIILPNDAKCHLTNNAYEKSASLMYDYPSISQLNQKAQENNINLIFAVTDRHKVLYQQLKDRIAGAAFGTLDGDSSNVITLVKKEYEKLRGSVSLVNADAGNGYIDMKFFSTCIGQPETETKECNNLEFHHVVNFTAKIQAYKCPNPGQIIPLEIKLVALNESLKINVEVLCSCSCENKNFEVDSAKCGNGGNLTCGVCACDAEHVGHNCECLRDAVDSANDNSKCMKDGELCSGLGVCKCGVCQCNPRNSPTEKIYGKYCECDNFSCDRKGPQLCSGPAQGDCKCGKCVCKPGWSGKACNCLESTDTCAQTTDDGTKVICSNQGSCVCGLCKCKVTDNERYSGKYCGECSTCPVDQRCEELKFCVDCKAYGSTNEECGKCVTSNVTKLATLRDVDSSKGEHRCLALVDSCRLEFIYKYVEGSSVYYIEALLEKDCSISGNVLAIILGVSGGTVILGLLILIIWKVLTSIHDRREYVKFEKERAMAKWDRGDNPLYKPSTQTFNNPTFGNNYNSG